MDRRLYRSRDVRMVAGVAGGLAAYLNIDPSLVRILWVVLIPLTGGLILLLYLAMALIVPRAALRRRSMASVGGPVRIELGAAGRPDELGRRDVAVDQRLLERSGRGPCSR